MPVVLPSETEGSLGFGGRLRLSVIGGAAMTVGLAPYLVFNVLEYKHMMPVSGAIKLHLETSELSPMPARAAVGVLSVICLFWLWSAARRRALPPPALGVGRSRVSGTAAGRGAGRLDLQLRHPR